MSKIWKFYLPPFLWGGIIFWNSSLPHVHVPKFGFQSADKLAHAVVYFILGYLIIRAVTAGSRNTIQWKSGLLLMLIGIFYGASDEFHQLFVPGRSADLLDWVADILGVVLGHLTFLRLQVRRAKLPVTTDSGVAAETAEELKP